jgi:hypothetical protein
MPPLEEKIKKTQEAFPARVAGAVAPCPTHETKEEPDLQKSMLQLTMEQSQAAVIPVAPVEEKQKEKKAWIEIILEDMEGKPVPNVRYRITPPGGGAPKEGRLNEHGQAGYYQIEPGQCKVTFPDLDKDAWD